MWNPFKRVETRASYTDSLVNLLVRQASGSALGQASETAAVEAAIGAWGRAFAGCQIAPQVDALDPFTLSRIARDLLLYGESLHVIEVAAGGLRILPVGDHDISGSGPDPDEWIYRCSLHGPSGSVTRSVPSAGVIHIRYSVDPSRPWKGVGPLKRAGLDADLLSALTTRMAEEAGASSALVIPSPVDGAADSTTTLRSDLRKSTRRAFDGRKHGARIWGPCGRPHLRLVRETFGLDDPRRERDDPGCGWPFDCRCAGGARLPLD